MKVINPIEIPYTNCMQSHTYCIHNVYIFHSGYITDTMSKTFIIRLPDEQSEYLDRMIMLGHADNVGDAVRLLISEHVIKTGGDHIPFDPMVRYRIPRDPRKPKAAKEKPVQKPKMKEKYEPTKVYKGKPLKPDLSDFSDEEKREFYKQHPELREND